MTPPIRFQWTVREGRGKITFAKSDYDYDRYESYVDVIYTGSLLQFIVVQDQVRAVIHLEKASDGDLPDCPLAVVDFADLRPVTAKKSSPWDLLCP